MASEDKSPLHNLAEERQRRGLNREHALAVTALVVALAFIVACVFLVLGRGQRVNPQALYATRKTTTTRKMTSKRAAEDLPDVDDSEVELPRPRSRRRIRTTRRIVTTATTANEDETTLARTTAKTTQTPHKDRRRKKAKVPNIRSRNFSGPGLE